MLSLCSACLSETESLGPSDLRLKFKRFSSGDGGKIHRLSFYLGQLLYLLSLLSLLIGFVLFGSLNCWRSCSFSGWIRFFWTLHANLNLSPNTFHSFLGVSPFSRRLNKAILSFENLNCLGLSFLSKEGKLCSPCLAHLRNSQLCCFVSLHFRSYLKMVIYGRLIWAANNPSYFVQI